MTSNNQNRMVWGLGLAATLAFAAVTADAYKRPTDVAHIDPAVLVDVPVSVPNVSTITLEPVVIIVRQTLKVSAKASYNRCTDCQFASRPLTQGSGSVKGFQP